VVNPPRYLADRAAGEPLQQQLKLDHQMNHNRAPKTVLAQQLAQVLRLRDGPRKTIEHETVRAVRSFYPLSNHFQHERIGNQLSARHNRLRLQAERSAVLDVLAKHVARRKMRRAELFCQHLRLRTLSRARRPEKN